MSTGSHTTGTFGEKVRPVLKRETSHILGKVRCNFQMIFFSLQFSNFEYFQTWQLQDVTLYSKREWKQTNVSQAWSGVFLQTDNGCLSLASSNSYFWEPRWASRRAWAIASLIVLGPNVMSFSLSMMQGKSVIWCLKVKPSPHPGGGEGWNYQQWSHSSLILEKVRNSVILGCRMQRLADRFSFLPPLGWRLFWPSVWLCMSVRVKMSDSACCFD